MKETKRYGGILVKCKNEVLLCKRNKFGSNLGSWSIPAGKLNKNELIQEKYRGIRPAPGYPANPDHTEKPGLFKLLNATKLTGVSLTESMAMYPASSVSGWYFSHPEAHYFGVGRIKEDQVERIAIAKKIPLSRMKQWLSSNLED